MSSLADSAAYFLIAHGSRDPRSRQALEACALMVRQQLRTTCSLENAWPLVGTGVLEFGDRSLAQQMATFAETASHDGIRRIYLLPLFLMTGHHMQQDLPEAFRLAKQQISPEIHLMVCPHLGSHPDLAQLVRAQMAETPCDQWILLAHGTRQPGGSQAFEDLAEQMGTLTAYWSTKPTLAEQLQALGERSFQRVGIVPYFLFPGGIIDAIGEDVNRLQLEFPKLALHLTQPLNPSALLAKLLLDRCASISAVQR